MEINSPQNVRTIGERKIANGLRFQNFEKEAAEKYSQTHKPNPKSKVVKQKHD